MQFETFDEDLTPTELSIRMLGKSKKQSELVDRILAANPHLVEMKTITKGTPVIKPADPSPDPRLAAAVDRAQQAIDGATKQRLTTLAAQRATLDDRMATIKQIRPSLPTTDAAVLKKVDEIQTLTRTALSDLATEEKETDGRGGELRELAGEAVPKALPLPFRR